MRVCFGLSIVAVLGFAGLLRAEPLDVKQINADAKWAVHVDFDAARASTVLQNAYQLLAEKHPELGQKLAEAREKWQFNPDDLHGVTFYGLQFKKGEGVATCEGCRRQFSLQERLPAQAVETGRSRT